MINDIDEAIKALVKRDIPSTPAIEMVFEAPTKDWASRRSGPALNLYLYDIREDLRRREVGRIDVQDATGRIIGRRMPFRFFKLSYLVTAWTQRPEDEHRMLAAALSCFARFDAMPAELLPVGLASLGCPVPVTIGLPPPEDRALSDVWSAVGGELKPSLDLVVTMPLDTQVVLEVGPPAERLDIGVEQMPDLSGRERSAVR